MPSPSESCLSILHFNDVYRVTPQKLSPSNSSETFDVTQFAALTDDLRKRWVQRADGTRDGLFLFSGDVFSPSVESSVTRGSHMVPVLNELGIDVSLTGNHDFDFGYPHLSKLIEDTKFPWILSNIIDRTTSRVPQGLEEFVVLERGGTRIGIVGLVEKDWVATVASWPSEFEYKSMVDTGIDLSRRLRDPEGEYQCDIIIALTHSRLPNDIDLAKQLFALSSTYQGKFSVATEHGVDLLLGGHDHLYFVGKGVDGWENFDVGEDVLGAEDDNGDVLVVKSGSDFRDVSELQLALHETPSGSVRRKTIARITGKRHSLNATSRSSESMAELLKKLLSSVSSTLKAPVCRTTTLVDVRSFHIRTTESASGNWFADVIRHAYDDTLCMSGSDGSDGVLICAGTLRGDSTYGPGIITLGDIMEILPFEDPILVLEVDGGTLWDAIEAALSKWPAQEGRFPVISGFRVSWDSRKEPGQRVQEIWFVKEAQNDLGNVLGLEPVKRDQKKYKIVTREYMADGHDGFLPLKNCKRLVGHECGTLMSSIVRRYLLGSHFVKKMLHLQKQNEDRTFHPKTMAAISHEQDVRQDKETGAQSTAGAQWKHAVGMIIQQRSSPHYRSRLNVSSNEHMSSVDAFDGLKARRGEQATYEELDDDEDLFIIRPEIDGRLADEARR